MIHKYVIATERKQSLPLMTAWHFGRGAIAIQAKKCAIPCYNLQPHKLKVPIKFIAMQYVLIIHEVENYEAWKQVFDQAESIRKEAGERSYQVLKYDNEPNKIVHFSAWTSTTDARAFFESPALVKIREEAGVKAPEFIYLDQLESGVL
jgi:quinol monooxygenase YgiN